MNNIRASFLVLGLVAAAAAQSTVVLSFGTTAGVPLTAPLTAPAVGGTVTISVFYTSTTAITSAEVFTGYAQSTTAGTGATPVAGTALTSLSSPVAAANDSLSGVKLAGGANTGSAPAGTARPYGLDIQGIVPSGISMLPATTTTPAKLFDVTLTNVALTTGTTTLSFYTGAPGSLFTTSFYDNSANLTTTTGTSLVLAAPVPEPGAFAALGLGALAMLRRRKRA